MNVFEQRPSSSSFFAQLLFFSRSCAAFFVRCLVRVSCRLETRDPRQRDSGLPRKHRMLVLLLSAELGVPGTSINEFPYLFQVKQIEMRSSSHSPAF